MSLMLAAEVIFRIWRKRNSRELALKTGLPEWSVQQIKEEAFIKNNHIFVLDNQVLNYSEYDLIHPGGRFTFDKNIGRDISKFFYGAYKLVNSN